ncbi:hypothetical protein ACT3XD_18590 [Halomonas sp. AOP7-B1-5]|uniref:hypothetical protein n=1 Tax=Halomonas sp. AOP7-B1-5 TaxID=3457642 RepID=UPI0040282DBC
MIPEEVLEYSVTVKLKEYSDMEIILLKGHLVLEQILYQFISAHQLDSKRVDAMNLMFSKTLELAMAIDATSIKDKYPHLKEINRIRNKIAHELLFDDYHEDLKKWASSVLGYTPKTINSKRTYKNHVIKAFSLLAGTLLGISNGIKVVKSPEE